MSIEFTGEAMLVATSERDEQVGSESWVERDHVMLLGYAATFVGIGAEVGGPARSTGTTLRRTPH